MKPWDPISRNPYRLFGIPREQHIPQDIRDCLVLELPALEKIQLTPQLFAASRDALQTPDLPLYRVTWFDSTRPLDQMAWLDVCEGRLQDAWRRWNSENHLLSLHNLAVLAHLRWLARPVDVALWRDCAQRYRELQSLTYDLGYQLVIDKLMEWHRDLAFSLVTSANAELLIQCWAVTLILSDRQTVEAQQTEMLSDDLQRWNVSLAQMRQALLEGAPVDRITRQYEQEPLAQAGFLTQVLLPGTPMASEFDRQLCLFYRLLARGWWARQDGESQAYAEAWLEKALQLSTEELRGEIRAELEHWRLRHYSVEARPAETSLFPAADPQVKQRRWGAIIAALSLIGLLWAFHRHESMPGMTRPAAQRRADQIVSEMSPLAKRLAELQKDIEHSQGSQQTRLLEEREKLQKRHAALKEELLNLQKWLDQH